MRSSTGLTLVCAAALLSACAAAPTGRAAIEQPAASCQPASVSLYFENNSTEVTREAAAVLRGAEAQARGCRIDGVRVMGLADAAGASADNLALSKARATAVTQALQRAGLPTAEFDVAAAGDAGAVNRQGEAAPLRRRVDVMIAVSAPAPAR
jgi:outer membrane protein OmpA-like peptidoglycan-associated protein